MAQSDELNSPEQWVDDPSMLQSLTPPQGVDVSSGDYYANVKIYRDGRRIVQWYKRGTGTSGEKNDPVLQTTESVLPNIRDKWEASQRAEQGQQQRGDQEGDTRGPQNGPTREEFHGGKWGVVPNPLYQANGTGSQAAAPGGKAFTDDGPEARENGRRWGWNAETKLYDRDLGPSPTAQEIIRNRSLPADQDPRAETDAERAARAKETIARQGREAEQNRGTTTLRPDGKGGTIAVTTYPDGRAPTTAPVPGVPTEAASKYTQVKQDPATGKWSGLTAAGAWEEIPGGPGITQPNAYGVEPAGAPPMTTTRGQVTTGLQTYSAYLSGEVKRWKDSGGKEGISPDEATKLMDRRLALAESAIKEGQGVESAQAGLYGNAITQRGQSLNDTASRRGTASSLMQSTLGQFVPLAAKIGPGGGALLNAAINDTLQSGLRYVDAFGGMRESPEVNPDTFPALAAVRQASQAGITTAANGGPQVFAPRPVTGASPPMDPAAAATAEASRQAGAAQLAAGRPPALLMPPPPVQTGPTAAPVPARAPSAAVPVANNPIDGTPITPPSPVVDPAAEQNRALSPDAVQGVTDTTHSITDGLINPGGTSPIFQPRPPLVQNQTPIDMPQGVDLSTPLQAPGAVPVGMSPRFMQEARYGMGNYFDPEQAGAQLAARLGIPPEIMAAATRGLYG